MFNRKRFTSLSFSFMLFAQSLFSQIILQGTVTDNGAEYLGNGAEPVINALVTITDQADAQRTFSGYTNDQGEYSIQISSTGVDDNNSNKPDTFTLLQNYPNPFNPSTVIGYELNKPSNITIEIYNVLGQKVRTLFDGFQTSGSGQVIWNATNDLGQGVPAGVYIYSLRADGININKKMLLIDGRQGSTNTAISNSGGTEATGQTVLPKRMSDQYLLQVTGDDIETHEQQNLEITDNTTLDITVNRTVTDIDGNVYRTVKIGDQWVLGENLKVTHYRNGETVPNVTDNLAWADLSTGAWCVYLNDANYADSYGCLYNWYAVNDSRNLAPAGWHVPTDAEWKELEMYLGMTQSAADGAGWRGTDEGGKLKETGTSLWLSPNTGATNESGFSALPGGGTSGGFYGFGDYAPFYSSTERYSDYAWVRGLGSKYSGVYRSDYGKQYGFSVRLFRD